MLNSPGVSSVAGSMTSTASGSVFIAANFDRLQEEKARSSNPRYT